MVVAEPQNTRGGNSMSLHLMFNLPSYNDFPWSLPLGRHGHSTHIADDG